MPERVRFLFGDRVLEGDVVERRFDPVIDAPLRECLSFDVGGRRYRTYSTETVA